MHRNHAYVRRKVSDIADKLKSLIELSAQDKHDSTGEMLSGCVRMISSDLSDIQFAFTNPQEWNETGYPVKKKGT